MSVQDFMSAGNGGNLTPAQINIAFKDYYGIDAPPKLLAWFQGESGSNPNFYNRVQSGAFTQDIAGQYPDYLEQSKIQKLTQQQLNIQKEANAPIIPTLEASKTSLQARYDAILSDLTNRETADTNALTKSTTSEFAKRGIPLSSDAYTRELASQLSPIRSTYGTQRATQQAQLGTDLNAIDKAIAELRAGNPNVAIPAANSLYNPVSSNSLSTQNAFGGNPLSKASIDKTVSDTQSNKYNDLANLIKQFQGLG